MSDIAHEIGEIIEQGRDGGGGNLLGIQPFISAADYASAEAFHARLDGYFREAARRGWLNARTIAVLPEYIGTWLAFSGEGSGLLRAKTLAGAARALALRHPYRFARAWSSAGEEDRVTASLLRLKGDGMARIYQAVFSGLALSHRVTVVAGSILLPEPAIRDGRVEAGNGAIQNVSAVYRPDGMAHSALVRKAFPISSERFFVASAPVAALPVFDTPAGRLGVLICADAWYPAAYAHLKAVGVELIAVPSGPASRAEWAGPWRGYDGAPTPEEVDQRDVGTLSEAQAWRRYALAGRMGQAGARCGIEVALRGRLWDLGADGARSAVVGEGTRAEPGADGAALLNLWL